MTLGRALESVLRRTGLMGRLQEAWRRDLARSSGKELQEARRATKRLEKLYENISRDQRSDNERLRGIDRRLEDMQKAVTAAADLRIKTVEKGLSQLALASATNDRQANLIADWSARFDPKQICAHVARAASAAPLEPGPCAHVVIDRLFPQEFYDLLVQSLPEPSFFPSRDPVKMNVRPAQFKIVPTLTRQLWHFVDGAASQTIAEVLLDRMKPFIRSRYAAMTDEQGAEAMLALPHGAFGGRLMLRRPGYLQKPHLDPKRAAITVLIYIARPGDPDSVGTSLYALSQPVAPVDTSTYYPEEHGVACTLTTRVPFHPNTAVAFVNAGGAHGASIPREAGSDDLLRYAFMYYIGPDVPRLLEFMSTRPAAEQQGWLGLAGWKDE